MWLFFSHIWRFPYFFLIFDGSILTLCSSNIICDNSFLTFGGSLTFFLIFNSFVLTLCGSNITYDNSSVTLRGSLTFFSHLTVLSSHCAVPTSYMTILLLDWMVPLLFSYTWRFHPHIVQFQYQMWQFFSHVGWFPYFFLTFDGFHPYIVQFQHHI